MWRARNRHAKFRVDSPIPEISRFSLVCHADISPAYRVNREETTSIALNEINEAAGRRFYVSTMLFAVTAYAGTEK